MHPVLRRTKCANPWQTVLLSLALLLSCCCRVLRHGRSKANEAGIIVSSIDNGVKSEYGLAESGLIQAAAAG
jgi:hypothetical protein